MSATAPSPEPVAGYGRVRRLGHFGTPDPTDHVQGPVEPLERAVPRQGPPGDPQAVTAPSARFVALVALALMTVGAFVLSAGIAFAVGWPWGLTTLGALILSVGVAFAVKS